jgi:pyruvate dehydrogenase (quinone)
VPYCKFAELIGLKGIFVDRAEAMGGAWYEALTADRPVVLEVKTDPEVPPGFGLVKGYRKPSFNVQ